MAKNTASTLGMVGSGAAAGAAFGPIGAGVGAGAGLAMSLMSGDDSAEQAARQKALDTIAGIPDPELQEILFQKLQTGEPLTAREEEVFTQADTELKKIQLDPKLRQVRMQALEQYGDLSRTGLGAEDRLALAEIRNKEAQDLQAQNASILQQRQMRGLGGQGDELAAQLMSAQQGSQARAAAADRVAAQAQAKSMAALGQQQSLAGDIEGGDYSRAANQAQAQDIISRFNVGQKQGAATRNVDRANRAAEQNWSRANTVSDKNVDIANEQAKMNQFEIPLAKQRASLARAVPLSSAYAGQATAAQADTAATQQGYQNLLAGAGTTAKGIKEYTKETAAEEAARKAKGVK